LAQLGAAVVGLELDAFEQREKARGGVAAGDDQGQKEADRRVGQPRFLHSRVV
jgi:hypothetical protein